MNARPSRLLPLPMTLCALLVAASCQIEDPPPAQTMLRIKLNDSLARYEKVVVEVYARPDSTTPLDTLWKDKLLFPSNQIPAYEVKTQGVSGYLVKVTGFKGGNQLALLTRIYYSPTGTIVRHDSVPPLIPQNWLKSLRPSVGSLSPDFSPDMLQYLVKLPQGVDSIYFTPAAPNPSVIVQANAQIIPDTKTTKTYRIGSSPDTVRFQVTDTSTGVSTTREYTVAMIPTPPPGLLLASLVPSTGRLGTEFTPNTTVYFLYMLPNVDTVSFRLSPLDPQTMRMTIDNQAVFSDQQSQVITVARGATYTVPIYVIKGSQKGYYQITLDHTQTTSH